MEDAAYALIRFENWPKVFKCVSDMKYHRKVVFECQFNLKTEYRHLVVFYRVVIEIIEPALANCDHIRLACQRCELFLRYIITSISGRLVWMDTNTGPDVFMGSRKVDGEF